MPRCWVPDCEMLQLHSSTFFWAGGCSSLLLPFHHIIHLHFITGVWIVFPSPARAGFDRACRRSRSTWGSYSGVKSAVWLKLLISGVSGQYFQLPVFSVTWSPALSPRTGWAKAWGQHMGLSNCSVSASQCKSAVIFRLFLSQCAERGCFWVAGQNSSAWAMNPCCDWGKRPAPSCT